VGPALEEAAAIAPSLPRPLEGVRVLVVEDQADARELIAVVLQQAGAQVTGVASAAEALRVFVAEGFDAIVSDIGLPDGDGYKLLQRIRQRGATVPAIALTAYTRIEDRERALSAGFQLHMAKPIEPWRLVAAVSTVCQRTSPPDCPPQTGA
jgi:CheY-like chemotaxis protein